MRSLLEPTVRGKALPARALNARDLAHVLRVLDTDPVASCMVAARLQEFGLTDGRGAAALLSRGGPAESLCFSGVNLMPLLGDQGALRAFADYLLAGPRACSSVVGRADLAIPLWEMLAAHWGPPREIRADQPLLASHTPAVVDADPAVRRVNRDELDIYLRAAVAMFTEEVGFDPRAGDGGRSYRQRVATLIDSGRAWARFDSGTVTFKAEVGALSRRTGQIQGVWVHPEHRGKGMGTAGTAAVVDAVVASGRIASLYVNDYNHIARRMYDRVGFSQVATFATVLLA